jgi:hypothetical protein
MSTMGPLCPEQLTLEETLEEVCVGPHPDSSRLSFMCQRLRGMRDNGCICQVG